MLISNRPSVAVSALNWFHPFLFRTFLALKISGRKCKYWLICAASSHVSSVRLEEKWCSLLHSYWKFMGLREYVCQVSCTSYGKNILFGYRSTEHLSHNIYCCLYLEEDQWKNQINSQNKTKHGNKVVTCIPHIVKHIYHVITCYNVYILTYWHIYFKEFTCHHIYSCDLHMKWMWFFHKGWN